MTLLRTASEPASDEGPYRDAIGLILYFAICTGPDILFAVGIVALLSEKTHHPLVNGQVNLSLPQGYHVPRFDVEN